MGSNQAVLAPALQEATRCPRCRASLTWECGRVLCTAQTCGCIFPVVNGVAVLIDGERSIFDPAHLASTRPRVLGRDSRWRRALDKYLPPLAANFSAAAVYGRLREALLSRPGVQRVLVLGSGTGGTGFDAVRHPGFLFTFTDVAFGPETQLLADAHDIPFKDAHFDAVVLQAVLEHVLDPRRVVEEAHRVLSRDGLVFAETPFMQQVHLGAFDFTRFTKLGHRWLFRDFVEIDSGVACGPAMALAWSIQYFFMSVFGGRRTSAAIRVLSRIFLFWLPRLDVWVSRRPGATDAASAFYFLGVRSEQSLEPREVVCAYDGQVAT